MTYGRLFTKMRNNFPEIEEMDLSSNKFSGLKRNEMMKIAKVLKNDGAWNGGNYTHMTNRDLAGALYTCVSTI